MHNVPSERLHARLLPGDAAVPDVATIYERLGTTPEALAAFCERNGIGRLRLFGSIVRDDFDLAKSDVDVLVEFRPGRIPGLEFFGMADDLEKLFGGRRVDLATLGSLSKYLRPHVLPGAREIYARPA